MQQPALNVCVFERAGLGQSDPPVGDVQAADAVDDLVQALAGRSIDGPIIVVGASYGGLVSQLFARLHPDKVAGVVLVDSIHADLDVAAIADVAASVSSATCRVLSSG